MKDGIATKIGLRRKFSIGIIVIVLCVAAAIIILGTRLYRNSIMERYTEMAYNVTQTSIDFYTDEEIDHYVELAQGYVDGTVDKATLDAEMQTDRYAQVKGLIRSMRANMRANDIFLCVIDLDMLNSYDEEKTAAGEWNPICYIMDNYQKEEEDLGFGDRSTVLPEYIDVVNQIYETGERPDTYVISHGRFGSNTTAMIPIVRDGKTVALAAAEIPMETLAADTKAFVIQITIIGLIVTLVLLWIGMFIITRTMINKILYISSEAQRFTEDNKVIEYKLEEIQSNDEIQTLSESLLKLEIGINEYIDNLTRVTAEKERIGAELNVATKIQADMLPRIFPAFPGRKEFDLFATMDPAKEVGGDFYDFFLVDDDHLAMVMADVSGKGVPAALFMVIAKTLIKNRAQMGGSPSEILGFVNDQLCEGNEAELFVTVWLGILEISTGKGMAANAGHEHPVIRRAGGDYELVEYKHSPAVATLEGIPFREHEFEMFPNDELFVYTDGVAEATNANNELYGTERMINALNNNKDKGMDNLLHALKKDVDEFVGDAPQFDDITMLGMVYYGPDVNSDPDE